MNFLRRKAQGFNGFDIAIHWDSTGLCNRLDRANANIQTDAQRRGNTGYSEMRWGMENSRSIVSIERAMNRTGC
jgi:hypothetical protein